MTQTQPIAATARALAARNDTEFVERAQRGDEPAFAPSWSRNNRRLYRVARTVLKEESEAGDAVQEAYLRAFAALSTFRGDASLATRAPLQQASRPVLEATLLA